MIIMIIIIIIIMIIIIIIIKIYCDNKNIHYTTHIHKNIYTHIHIKHIRIIINNRNNIIIQSLFLC